MGDLVPMNPIARGCDRRNTGTHVPMASRSATCGRARIGTLRAIPVGMQPTTKLLTVYTRGADLSAVTDGLKDAWRMLYCYSLCQVWTWRGGEAIVACDFQGNYGRGEYRVVVRTGGLKHGKVQVLIASCFRDAMIQLGLSFRIATGMRPRRPRTAAEIHRATIARAAHRAGNTFRTLRARPAFAAAA